MGMAESIKARDLRDLAILWGRKPSVVRSAVDQGFIPAGEPGESLGYGRPPEWTYPDGTDVTLRTYFRLQDLGYRGGNMKLSLWWFERFQFNEDLRDYILACFTSIRKPVNKKILDKLGQVFAGGGTGTQTADDLDEIRSVNIFATQITDWLKAMDITTLRSTGDAFGIKTRLNLSAQQIMFRIFVGSMFDLPFHEIEIHPDGINNLITAYEQRGSQTSDQMEFMRRFAALIVQGNIFAWTIKQIENSPPHIFGEVRAFLKSNKAYRYMLRKTSRLFSLSLQIASEREKARLGLFRFPEAWARGFMVGWMVSNHKIAREINDERNGG